MLSYQHAYHAGSAADVHKHVALLLVLRRLARKDAPFTCIDAHAGRGLYDLTSAEARKTRESEHGIIRLAAAAKDDAADAPAAVRDYLERVRAFNPTPALSRYPGSAMLAQAVLREQDRLVLLELHPSEVAALKAAMAKDRRVAVHARDCYEGLPALLPPPIRRGLVLIDPSYEIKSEYGDVVDLLAKALERWATGVYLLWYPLLPAGRHRRLLRRLEALAPPKLHVDEYRFAAAAGGLEGSGLAIVNTPWQLDRELATAMRYVAKVLGHDAKAGQPDGLRA